MLRMGLALTLALGVFAGQALAQQTRSGGTKQEQDACARDVNRHCRKVADQGDMVILRCLQQNRSRLTNACRKVLSDSGR